MELCNKEEVGKLANMEMYSHEENGKMADLIRLPIRALSTLKDIIPTNILISEDLP